ncbi:MAG: hypothetical protein ACI8UD_004149, partial [Planctomycetota bacterium]
MSSDSPPDQKLGNQPEDKLPGADQQQLARRQLAQLAARDAVADKAEVEAHVLWLETLAASQESLAEVDEETLIRLRKAAGLIAFPDRAARRKLANTRRGQQRRKVRD